MCCTKLYGGDHIGATVAHYQLRVNAGDFCAWGERMSRYIDADKQIPLIRMGETNEYTELGEGRNGGITFAIERIKQMPTADVRPNVHGEWVDVGSLSCRCNNCGCKNNKPTRFCPNCNADMRGDGK